MKLSVRYVMRLLTKIKYMNKKNIILGSVLLLLIFIAYIYKGNTSEQEVNIKETTCAVDKVQLTEIGMNEIVELLEEVDSFHISNFHNYYIKIEFDGGDSMFDGYEKTINADSVEELFEKMIEFKREKLPLIKELNK